MGFSSLLGTSADRGPRPASTNRPRPPTTVSDNSVMTAGSSRRDSTVSLTSVPTAPPEYIFDESQLGPLPSDAPDLRELNNCLEALAAVFPDLQIDVFREMLSSFEGESRLALVADALLKNRVTWVKGRWKVVNKEKNRDHNDARTGTPIPHSCDASSMVPKAQVFRSHGYKKAVQSLAWHEFKGLSRSTINAVLAEQNYSYLEARRELVGLSSKSWRFTISSLFLRRKAVTTGEAENHPLIIWRSSGQGSIIPSIRATGNEELNQELFNELISPLKRKAREDQEERDRKLALGLNEEEAEKYDATYDCVCCYGTAAFEEFTTCNQEGHMICFRCVQHSISEAVFGQGWHRTIDHNTGTLRCLAIDSEECAGRVPADQIHRAMMEQKKGAEIMLRLEQRLAEHSLLASQQPLVRCPFCDYAEIDDVYLPSTEPQYRLRADSIWSMALILILLGMTPFLLPVIIGSSFLALLFSTKSTFGDLVVEEFRAALNRHRRRRRGLKFACQSPACGRVSCLDCAKEWADIHVCHESSLVALRTQVEQAMSMAIKRVCPRCNTSFVKNAGCNKLTCPCGYRMCYVCRKDIGSAGDAGEDVGYQHFCQHFRPHGDGTPCRECNRCNLWESEDTDAVLEAARKEAEEKWREMEKRELSGSERAFVETGVAVNKRKSGGGGGGGAGAENRLENALYEGRLPSMAQVCDWVVETVIV